MISGTFDLHFQGPLDFCMLYPKVPLGVEAPREVGACPLFSSAQVFANHVVYFGAKGAKTLLSVNVFSQDLLELRFDPISRFLHAKTLRPHENLYGVVSIQMLFMFNRV